MDSWGTFFMHGIVMGVTIEVFAPFTLSGALDAPCGRYLRLRGLLGIHPSDVTIKVGGMG